jgi:hypothetical protein
MTTPTSEAVAAIADGLTKAQRSVMAHASFDPKGWEPPDPFSALCTSLVDLGLFNRADGRCGFEAFKDSFIVPTDLGLAVRAHLQENDHAN